LKPEGLKDLDGNYELTLPTEKSYFTKQEVMDMIGDYEVFVPNFSF
jgi:hypothetical protein